MESEYRDSKLFWGAFAGLMAVLGAVSSTVWGWGPVGLVFFGVYTVFALTRLLSGRVRLQVGEDGIVDRTFWYSPGLIPWGEILDIRSTRFGFIEVELRDEAALLARLSPLSRWARWKFPLYGLGPAAIVPWGLEAKRSELIEVLQSAHDEFVVEATKAGHALAGDRELP